MSYYRYITGIYKSYWPELNRTLRSSSAPRHIPEAVPRNDRLVGRRTLTLDLQIVLPEPPPNLLRSSTLTLTSAGGWPPGPSTRGPSPCPGRSPSPTTTGVWSPRRGRPVSTGPTPTTPTSTTRSSTTWENLPWRTPSRPPSPGPWKRGLTLLSLTLWLSPQLKWHYQIVSCSDYHPHSLPSDTWAAHLSPDTLQSSC